MKKRIFCFICSALLLFSGSVPISADSLDEKPIGTSFIDRLVFFGESTTTHLRGRSTLRAEQIWANESGTARLDSTLASRPIKDASGVSITPVEVAKRERPDFIVLSFGLNGIMDFARDPSDYLAKYQKLIDTLAAASPNTEFLIQSVYPVAEDDLQADWRFSVKPQEINQKITQLNQCMQEFCETASNCDFIDTSCNLTDQNGFLRAELTTDGIHLNEHAYRLILDSFTEYGKMKV